jgi:lipopolysaccharide export system protein LptA
MKVLRLIGICVLIMAVQSSFAQKKDRLKVKSNLGKKGRDSNNEDFQRLLQNVVIKQKKTTIYCDSAHYYKKKNSVKCFGRVKIVDGDSVTITSKYLEYDGNSRQAKLRNNVVFNKLSMATLYTDFLDYSRPLTLAYYYNGGRLVDSINVLTSTKGYYNTSTNLASFKKNVNVTNPDYTLYSDSLQYNSKSKIIFFVAETTVINKDSSRFVYQTGQYDTQRKTSDIQSGIGESKDYTIEAEIYETDQIRNIAKARTNVKMTHKTENLIIYGQASDHFKKLGITKIYNNAYIAKITDNLDTLFITADTLVSIENEDPLKKRLLAYQHVKIFKSDLQGIADSLEYRVSDSVLFFYKKPILWNVGNQMTADSISMQIANNTINKIFMVANAFVISKDTLLNFNQIKGRKMTAEFANSKINRVLVMGNGESIYFALDDKDQLLLGMNKIICSNITIRFKEGKVNNLSFYVQPDANFIPPHELKAEDKLLKGFEWKEKEKPLRKDVVKPRSEKVSFKTEAQKSIKN